MALADEAVEALMLAYPGIADIDIKATMALSALQGIAMQALFDPDNWPPARQRAIWRRNAQAIIGEAAAEG